MTLVAALAVVLSTAAWAPDPTECIDPAKPLRVLAAEYDRWPAAETPLARTAFAEFRRYLESGSPKDYHRTELRYRSLLSLRPSDLSIVLPLGVLYASGPDLNYPEARGYRSVSISTNSVADGRGARLLVQVVEADSTQWLAAVALARMALASLESPRRRQAEHAVRRALQADPGSVVLNLALRDILIDAGDFHAARAIAEGLTQSCAPVLHAKAEAFILTGDTAEGAALYTAGLDLAGAGQLSRFEEDVWLLFTAAQRAAFDRVPPEGRADWLRQFWHRAAALGGSTEHSRIVRHLQATAWSNAHSERFYYPPSSDRPIGWLTDTIHREPWDHRAIINVRHGTPGIKLVAEDPPVRYEAWIYQDEEAPWILLFSGSPYSRAWDLVDRPDCGHLGISFLGPSPPLEAAKAKASSGESLDLRELYMLAAQYDRRFADLVKACTSLGAVDNEALRDLELHYRRLWKSISWGESGGVHYVRKLRLYSRTYQFFDADRQPDYVTLTWIPTEQLSLEGPPLKRLGVTHVISDSIITAVRADTVLSASLPKESGLLRLAVRWDEMPITEGVSRVTVLDMQDSGTGGRLSAPFSARRSSSRIDLSDLVLAEPDEPGLLVRGAHSVSPLPASEIRVGDSVRLYFEVYGAKEGDPLETRLRLQRIDRSGLGPLRKLFPNAREAREIRYSGIVEWDVSGITPQDLVITADLLPGEYTLDVEVKTPEGAARHKAQFRVLAPEIH